MKPIAVEVHPVYICPQCRDRHCESMEYANKVGKILCCCGHVFTLDPIHTFNVTPVYRKAVEKKQVEKEPFNFLGSKNKDIIDNINIDTNKRSQKSSPSLLSGYEKKCVELLCSLGWKKKESKGILSRVFNLWIKERNKNICNENIDDFIHYLIRNQKC